MGGEQGYTSLTQGTGGSVFQIPGQGTADMRELGPDLVVAPRQEANLQQSPGPAGLQDPIIQDSGSAPFHRLVVGQRQIAPTVPHQMMFQAPLSPWQVPKALHQGQVAMSTWRVRN